MVEVVLSTVRPADLLAGKVMALGPLGMRNLLLVGVVGLGAAQAVGTLDIDGEILAAVALALAWFLVGYAFYACAFAIAGGVLRTGSALKLREAWRAARAYSSGSSGPVAPATRPARPRPARAARRSARGGRARAGRAPRAPRGRPRCRWRRG